MYSEYTVSERAVATVTDCVVASIRYVFGVYSQTVQTVSWHLYVFVAVATVTVSWRLYDMYSEYTVSERAEATVTVSWRLYDMYSEYTVKEQ